jgi:hypothetical protein
MTIRNVQDADVAWGPDIRAVIARINDLGDTPGTPVPVARVGTGSGTTTGFLRGDGTFALPAAQVALRTVSGTADTLVAGDAGKVLLWTNSSAGTQTVPTNASVAFPVGTVIRLTSLGGQVTLAPASSVVKLDAPRGLKTASQYSTLQILKIAADEWVVSGDAVQATTPNIPFLLRASSALWEGSTRFRFFGANAYWLALNDNLRDGSGNPTYPSAATVDATFQALSNMGARIARVHTLGISVGKPMTMMPTLGVWDPVAVDKADYVIKSAKAAGIRLMIPLVDRWNFYHGGGVTWAGFRGGSDMAYFYTNSQVRTDFKAYIYTLLNHVNPYTGLAWKNDPTIAIWETGNEIYDAPLAWTSDIAAYLKTNAPNQLVADGTAASGMHVTNSAITDPNIDIMGGHFYEDHAGDRVWVRGDAAAAVSAGKAYIVGEYDWTDGSNNGSTTPSVDATRAQWLSEMETNGNITGDIMWTVVHNAAGVHRDNYELYVPTTENSEQAAGLAAFTAHAAVMAGSSVSPTDYSSGTVSDSFTGANGDPVDGGKWAFLESPTNGAGLVDIQSNRARMLTASTGSYGDKLVLISQAGARADAGLAVTAWPQDLTKESYFSGILRGQTTDLSVGDTTCYKFEIGTGGGAANISVVKRVAGVQTVLASGTAISGAASGQPIYIEFSVAGTVLTLRAWTGNALTNRPVTPTWTGADSSVSAAGKVALILNGGAAATAVDWRIDDVTIYRFVEEWTSFTAATNWADASVHGSWTTVFAGGGPVGVELESSAKVHTQTPTAPVDSSDTHSSLVRTTASFSGNMDVTYRMKTVSQTRTGAYSGAAANAWERGWVLWQYTDNTHFYYFVVKTNGWELGKEDPAYAGSQRFLASGSTPTSALGTWNTVRVQQAANVITVSLDGTVVTTFTDNERPYTAGSVGLYNEDAHVRFGTIHVA